jgi:beta-N-acetylhexosaminidase
MLAAIGFNLDFAPVVDLCGPESSNGIGDRSFGTDARRVTELAGEFLGGLQQTGVAGCLKHFPGLGDTRVDSHLELPTVERTRERLEAEDLLPYRRLASLAASVMVGHGHYPALDSEGERPASCSPRIVNELLRRRIGYTGLVVSDDLEMGAVSRRDRDGAAALESLLAGCDLLLYCADLDRAEAAARAIGAAADRDRAIAARLRAAAAAVLRATRLWDGAAPTGGGWESVRAGMAEFASLT